MKSQKKDLEAKIRDLHSQLDAIREVEDTAEAQKLVGRYFKYRNCYSLPKSDADYWWIYAAVTHVEDGSACAIRFEMDNAGKVTVERYNWFRVMADGGWKETTRADVLAGWQTIQNRLDELALHAGI